jgi:hypothetical protein
MPGSSQDHFATRGRLLTTLFGAWQVGLKEGIDINAVISYWQIFISHGEIDLGSS